jgi:hypothetical protein
MEVAIRRVASQLRTAVRGVGAGAESRAHAASMHASQ